MCQTTFNLISPSGVPVTLHATDADDQQSIHTTIDRAENSASTMSLRFRRDIKMARVPLTSGTE